MAEGSGDLPHGGARGHCGDGGHHGHVLAPETPVDVVDHLVAPRGVEIDVDVGHLAAGGVQEALEEQVVLDGVGVGDPERVGHDRVAGAPAARTTDPPRLRVVHHVLDDQEVLREPEIVDRAELSLQPRERLGRQRPVAALQTAPGGLREHGVRTLTARHLHRREVELPQSQVQVAALGDRQRRVAGSGNAREEASHLRPALEVQLPVRALVGAGQRDAAGCRGEDIGEAELLGANVVHVVRGHDGEPECLGELQQPRDVARRLGREVVHEFHVEAPGREAARQLAQRLACTARLTREHGGARLTASAPGEPDQPLRAARQVRQRHHRGVLAEALRTAPDVRARQEAAEVAVAGDVLGEKGEVEAGPGAAAESDGGGDRQPLLGRQVRLLAGDARGLDHHLGAQDRLDPGAQCLLVEAYRAVEALVVGEREGGRSPLDASRNQVVEVGGAVSEREPGVGVEVHEGHSRTPSPRCRRAASGS